MERTPSRWLAYAAFVIAAAFTMHSLNGLIIERTVLHLKTFNDYASVPLLKGAIGSWPWRLSGLGHLLSGFAMVVVALELRRWMDDRDWHQARAVQAFALLSATGFLLNGIASGLGAQVVHLLSTQNPADADSAIVTYSFVVPVVNGLAIVCLGVVVILIARFAAEQGIFGRGFVIYSWITGVAGLVMAFAYLPAYLFLDLIWLLWFGVGVLRVSRESALGLQATRR
jgi:hypothetical protein